MTNEELAEKKVKIVLGLIEGRHPGRSYMIGHINSRQTILVWKFGNGCEVHIEKEMYERFKNGS